MNEKTETPETLAALLAEMRHRADNYRQDGWESVAEELEELCERIDAAAAREYAQWHGETNAAKEERNRIACKMRYEFAAKCRACKSAPGNDAAMREALEYVLEKIDAWRTDGTMEHWQYAQLFDTCDAALAAPARNCDILSEEAANKAWDDYRHANVLPRGGWDFRHIIAWLFAPAEGGDHA